MADDQWLVAQFGPVALFDGCVECIAIDMRNRQNEKLGVTDKPDAAATGATAPGRLHALAAIPAETRQHDE
jgi:hypothetical protein